MFDNWLFIMPYISATNKKVSRIDAISDSQLILDANLIDPFYAGSNLSLALFTRALISPGKKCGLTPIRAHFYFY